MKRNLENDAKPVLVVVRYSNNFAKTLLFMVSQLSDCIFFYRIKFFFSFSRIEVHRWRWRTLAWTVKMQKPTFNKWCDNPRFILLSRFMWVLVFFAGLSFSGYFCFQMWQKWDESPVLTSLDSNYFPLANIPFPAVTICNVNKVSKKKLLRAMENPKWLQWFLYDFNKRIDSIFTKDYTLKIVFHSSGTRGYPLKGCRKL